MGCPLCGDRASAPFAEARDLEYFTSDEMFRYVACSACGVVYLESPPIDRLHEVYPPSYYSYAPGGGPRTPVRRLKEWLDARSFRRLLARIPGDRLSVLDVGGGSGWLLTLIRRLSPRIAETHEVDIDENARATAEAAGHVFHATRIEEFIPGHAFDLILMLNLIEHVADPGSVLRAMGESLSARGLILIKTPNIDTLDRRLFQHRNWGGFHCPRHWVLFTRKGLVELAARSGLRCIEVRYTQGGWQWSASILSLLHQFGWIAVGRERPVHTHPLFLPIAALMAGFDFLRRPFAPTAQMILTFARASGYDKAALFGAANLEAPGYP
jgi:SAM-dependent methyltransferase